MFKYIYHGLFHVTGPHSISSSPLPPVVNGYNGFILAPLYEMATNIAHSLATFYSYILMSLMALGLEELAY